MVVLEEMKTIVNGYDTVRLRPFTVSIRCKTADRIVSVKLEKTAKYGPFTIRSVFLRQIIRSDTDRKRTVCTPYRAVNAPFLPCLRSVFGS